MTTLSSSARDVPAGAAALGMAATYVIGFAYFGGAWAYPADAPAPERMAYLADHRVGVHLAYLTIYLLFGGLLSVLVVRLRARASSDTLMATAALFGAIWAGLVLASGMLFTAGLHAAVALAGTDAERAAEVWDLVALFADGIGGGNELVGGLWVLLTSAHARRRGWFSTRLNTLGLAVGAVGVATLYPSDLLPAIFGVAQIVWFVGVGCALLNPDEAPGPPRTATSAELAARIPARCPVV